MLDLARKKSRLGVVQTSQVGRRYGDARGRQGDILGGYSSRRWQRLWSFSAVAGIEFANINIIIDIVAIVVRSSIGKGRIYLDRVRIRVIRVSLKTQSRDVR